MPSKTSDLQRSLLAVETKLRPSLRPTFKPHCTGIVQTPDPTWAPPGPKPAATNASARLAEAQGMASSGQSRGLRPTSSAHAVHYLNYGEEAIKTGPRPEIIVPSDHTYSLRRFATPQGRPEDQFCRPPIALRTPLTEEQSQQRMATILATITKGPATSKE
ncbi:hypothetical protein DL771_008472 [Monosporascus sp. 5C6A]|nr:hypothetical protein DL771_008472 [Monosporascus sp. 5C6A]